MAIFKNTIRKGFDSMIHIDSANALQGVKLIQADLTKFKTDMPDDYDLARMDGLSRKFSVVFYPDAQGYPFANEDELRACLYDYCVQHNSTGVLSPCHCLDRNIDGSLEKAHYHFYTVTKGPSYSQDIRSLAYFINGNKSICRKVDNELGYYRYMAHLDEGPEKARYDVDDITVFNGYVPPASGEKSSASSTEQLLELVSQFASVRDLTVYVVQCRPDLVNTLIRARNVIATYYGEYERHWTTS